MKKPQDIRNLIDGNDAHYVVERWIKTRRTSVQAVLAIVAEKPREIAAITARLAELKSGDQHASDHAHRSGASAKRHRKRGPASPQLLESRRVQGEYMGRIRHLTGAARERIKKLAAEQGRAAAIKAMRPS